MTAPAVYTRDGLATRILVALERMSVDELAVIAELCERVDRARAQYGALRLDTDTRNFTRELHEEVVDGLFYAAAAIVRGRRL